MMSFITSSLAVASSSRHSTTKCRFAMVRISVALTLLAALSVTPASAQLREAALGVWLEQDGEAHIEIAPCEDKLCGRIVWLRKPMDDAGRPQMDLNNPNPALRTRPILGMLIMADLQPNDDNTYLEGRVYNSENGKIYDVFLTPKGNTMDIEGCLVRILCATQTWTRIR